MKLYLYTSLRWTGATAHTGQPQIPDSQPSPSHMRENGIWLLSNKLHIQKLQWTLKLVRQKSSYAFPMYCKKVWGGVGRRGDEDSSQLPLPNPSWRNKSVTMLQGMWHVKAWTGRQQESLKQKDTYILRKRKWKWFHISSTKGAVGAPSLERDCRSSSNVLVGGSWSLHQLSPFEVFQVSPFPPQNPL